MQRALAAAGLVIACGLAVVVLIVMQGYITAPSAVDRAHLHPMTLKVADLTAEQQQLLLKVQDPNFYSHSGVDFSASASGSTTITQALIKQLYFRKFSPGFLRLGKIRLMLLSIGFNRRVPKDEQLLIFINRVYLGNTEAHRVYGFEDAAHSYYDKPFAALSRQEYVSLVAAIIAPATFNPAAHRIDNLKRVGRIERLIEGACVRSGKADVFYAGCAK
jgi:membrane peptidoglycan carboxypeptidase